MTHEEMVVNIRAAVATIPPLGKQDWKTVYQSLARERRRVSELLKTMEDEAPEGPEVNAFLGRLRDQVKHINKIMNVIGEQGRTMLITLPYRAQLDCRKAGSDCEGRRTKCDGRHRGPSCGDPECWRGQSRRDQPPEAPPA